MFGNRKNKAQGALNRSRVYEERGDVAVFCGNHERARQEYQNAKRLLWVLVRARFGGIYQKKDHADLSVKLGDALRACGDTTAALYLYEKALETYKEAHKQKPWNKDWHENLAVCQERIGDTCGRLGWERQAQDAYIVAYMIRDHMPHQSDRTRLNRILGVLKLGFVTPVERASLYQWVLIELEKMDQSGELPGDAQKWIVALRSELQETGVDLLSRDTLDPAFSTPPEFLTPYSLLHTTRKRNEARGILSRLQSALHILRLRWQFSCSYKGQIALLNSGEWVNLHHGRNGPVPYIVGDYWITLSGRRIPSEDIVGICGAEDFGY